MMMALILCVRRCDRGDGNDDNDDDAYDDEDDVGDDDDYRAFDDHGDDDKDDLKDGCSHHYIIMNNYTSIHDYIYLCIYMYDGG